MSDKWDNMKGDLADAIDEIVEKYNMAVADIDIRYPADDEIEIWVDLVVDDVDDDDDDDD